MKRLSTALVLVTLAVSLPACAPKSEHDGWSHYGADVDAHAVPQISIGASGDPPAATADGIAKLEGTVHEVCVVKGCWMTLRDETGTEVLVRFRDYGFFVPRNAMRRQAWVVGTPQKQTLSIEALQHLAHGAGRTEAEIAAITRPEDRLTIIADAVWIQGPGLQDPYRAIGKEDCPPVDAGVAPAALGGSSVR